MRAELRVHQSCSAAACRLVQLIHPHSFYLTVIWSSTTPVAAGLQSYVLQTATTAQQPSHTHAFGNCWLFQASEMHDSFWHVSVPHSWTSLSRVPTSYKGQPQHSVKPSSWTLIYVDKCGLQSGSRTLRCDTGLWPSSAYVILKTITMKPQAGRKAFLVTVLQKPCSAWCFLHIGTLPLGRPPSRVTRTSY